MEKISKNLFEKERGRLVTLLKKYKDVFSWSYQEMPSLSSNLGSIWIQLKTETETEN